MPKEGAGEELREATDPSGEPTATIQSWPVVIVVPPVVHIGYPAIGPSVLAAACRRDGVPARVTYPSIDFAVAIGADLNKDLVASPEEALIGEALFAAVALPRRGEAPGALLDRIFEGRDAFETASAGRPLTRESLRGCERLVAGFVVDATERIASWRPRIVAFSSLFQQTLASVALARAVKERCPGVVTVLGGANAREPMGSALLGTVDVFDFSFSGEADVEFPAFCSAYLEKGRLPSRQVIECEPPGEMDRVPIPCYDDYFSELKPRIEAGQLPAAMPYFLPFESSRGCFYAAAKPCAFCAFNTTDRRYRAKSGERIVSEMRTLSARHGNRSLWAVDNVMPRVFLKEVAPRLIEDGSPFTVAYEVRPELTARQLRTLADGGVRTVQPGVEALSSRLLAMMGKGSSAMGNIRLLRDCRSLDLEVIWNLLHSVPGEIPGDYEAPIAILPLLEHLHPPFRLLPVLFHRYSAYHENPAAFGLRALRPLEAYAIVYGDAADTGRLAHAFEADFERVSALHPGLWSEFESAVTRWVEEWGVEGGPPRVEGAELMDGGLRVTDTRRCAIAGEHLLALEEVAALLAVAAPARQGSFLPAQAAVLEGLVSKRLVLAYEDQLLSLVTGVQGGPMRKDGPGEAVPVEGAEDA